MLVLSGSMTWAAAHEYQTRSVVPNGVTVAGKSLAGLDAEQARIAIATAVTEPLTRPIAVTADGKAFTYEPREAVHVDTDSMVANAFAPRRGAVFVARLRHDLAGVPLVAQIEPEYSVDESAVAEWVRGVAAQIDRPAIDATVTVRSGEVTLTPSKVGKSTAIDESAHLITGRLKLDDSIAEKDRSVTLAVSDVKPKVTEKDLGKTIVVDLSRRKIWLYDKAKLEKTYRCAIGTPWYPTPTGHYKIELKRYRPTWVNPAPNGWGKGMPAYIPPGPSNPLGTRAINLTAPGIRFHGTNNIGSVGTAASHGCMRMYRWDIEDFYERVEVGTDVYILP